MEFPAVTVTELPESICGRDERVRVDPMTSQPYNWICFLSMTAHDGGKYLASGFKIHLPDVNSMAVVTSGHCTYIKGAYAKQISVTFPGEGTVTVGTKDLYASPEYIANGNPDYDYGLIILPGDSNEGFGWTSIISNDQLNNRLVTNCGYPGDKPRGTLWITGGPIDKYTDYRIFYMNDTYGGQSGSPVYTWYEGYWTVLGIHSYGGCPNSAPRFTSEMILRFLQRMNAIQQVALRSFAFPDVYMRCDGNGVVAPSGPGGGTVNCQFKPPGPYEQYFIYPVAMNPSLAPDSVYPVVILSAYWENIYIRMDGSGMTKFKGTGGGVVNCQYGANTYERFNKRKRTDGTFSFQNLHFPQCSIRLDGTGVTKHTGPGGGVVNCQYYDDPNNVGLYERFYII